MFLYQSTLPPYGRTRFLPRQALSFGTPQHGRWYTRGKTKVHLLVFHFHLKYVLWYTPIIAYGTLYKRTGYLASCALLQCAKCSPSKTRLPARWAIPAPIAERPYMLPARLTLEDTKKKGAPRKVRPWCRSPLADLRLPISPNPLRRCPPCPLRVPLRVANKIRRMVPKQACPFSLPTHPALRPCGSSELVACPLPL